MIEHETPIKEDERQEDQTKPEKGVGDRKKDQAKPEMNIRVFNSQGITDGSVGPLGGAGHYTRTGETSRTDLISPRTARIRLIQRCLDVILTLIVIVGLSPVLLVLALIVRFDSPGPVFFRQKRVGQHGEEFWFYKYRSMVADAEARRVALLKINEASGPLFKIKNDPRITRSGRWMRKYSLDELPQLFNVLIGDMSLVGPRPCLPVEVAEYLPRQKGRHAVKPGITGLWQVSGRSDLPFERSIELDLEYISHQSIGLYISILMRTIPAVLEGRGAY